MQGSFWRALQSRVCGVRPQTFRQYVLVLVLTMASLHGEFASTHVAESNSSSTVRSIILSAVYWVVTVSSGCWIENQYLNASFGSHSLEYGCSKFERAQTAVMCCLRPGSVTFRRCYVRMQQPCKGCKSQLYVVCGHHALLSCTCRLAPSGLNIRSDAHTCRTGAGCSSWTPLPAPCCT